MSEIAPATENPLLRLSIPQRAGSLLNWMVARPEERLGCLAIGRCGGSYTFSRPFPFVSPIRSIYVRRPRFTDAHMEHLHAFRGLVSVDVGDTSVSERGVACLLNCLTLRYLFLWGTCVGDRILDVVREMPKLELLNLSGTNVSRSTFDRVCKFLPNCFISHAVFGDYFRNLSGSNAASEWVKYDEPGVERWKPELDRR